MMPPSVPAPAACVVRRRDRQRADGDAGGAEGARLHGLRSVGRGGCTILRARRHPECWRAATSPGCRRAAVTRTAQLRRGIPSGWPRSADETRGRGSPRRPTHHRIAAPAAAGRDAAGDPRRAAHRAAPGRDSARKAGSPRAWLALRAARFPGGPFRRARSPRPPACGAGQVLAAPDFRGGRGGIGGCWPI
jgi:hypothetical protein